MKTKFAAAFFAILSVGVVGGACNTEVRSYKTGSYVTEFVHSFPGDTYYWCEPANKNVPNHGGGATIVERDSACSPQ